MTTTQTVQHVVNPVQPTLPLTQTHPTVIQANRHLDAVQNQNNLQTLQNIDDIRRIVQTMQTANQNGGLRDMLRDEQIRLLQEQMIEREAQHTAERQADQRRIEALEQRVQALAKTLSDLMRNTPTKQEFNGLADSFNSHAHGYTPFQPGTHGTNTPYLPRQKEKEEEAARHAEFERRLLEGGKGCTQQ